MKLPYFCHYLSCISFVSWPVKLLSSFLNWFLPHFFFPSFISRSYQTRKEFTQITVKYVPVKMHLSPNLSSVSKYSIMLTSITGCCWSSLLLKIRSCIWVFNMDLTGHFRHLLSKILIYLFVPMIVIWICGCIRMVVAPTSKTFWAISYTSIVQKVAFFI